jgi:preprotein translocase subunit SecA
MLNLLKSFFNPNSAQLAKTDAPLAKIKELRESMPNMSIQDIRTRVAEMQSELKVLVDNIPDEEKLSLKKLDRTKALSKNEIAIQQKLYEFMPEVYAFVDEIFFRKVGFRYHDVQLRAGIILAQGQRLVELYTGEGKTMTFQLPAILYSLVGRGAHVITVNDYLSRRDGEYAGHIAIELGLRVGIINSETAYKFIADDEIEKYKGTEVVEERNAMQGIDVSKMNKTNLIEVTKKDAYNCDITYGTNNEFGFDYLRDNMSWDLENIVQRELYFCIIDEADSILIDEARTPLIISGVPSDADANKYVKFARAAAALNEIEDYIIDHKRRTVSLTEEGIKKAEQILEIENLWSDYSSAYHIENALQAKARFHKDEHYIVRNGEVLIVDEFTGRVLQGRRYSEGLHQAIEAKEGVAIQPENRTFATITFQNYFRLYKILCGGSGTIMTEGEEFYKIYGLESIPIPTHKPVIRIDSPDRIYKTQQAKFKAVIEEIKNLHAKGQPILVGTTSVEKSELVSRLLDEAGIEHEVLNAKFHEQEAKIIEQAGRRGAVTVATNMAGRGADIVIGGGRRGDEAWKEIVALGGLHVIGTERHEARRIDNQLRGRTGRQGEPGSSRFYVSFDDTLMKILGGDIIARLLSFAKMDDETAIELNIITKQIEGAQKKIENRNFDSRKNLVDYDDVMNQHREVFYTLRRNFLIKLSGAEGKFLFNGEFINLTFPQFRKLKESLNDKQTIYSEEIKNAISNIYSDVIENIILVDFANKDFEKIKNLVITYIPQAVLAEAIGENNISDTGNQILEMLRSSRDYEKVSEMLHNIFEKSLEIKYKEFDSDLYNLTKILLLQAFDNMWAEHLETMKDVKEGIFLQSYAQKDPLIEYKNKAYNIFTRFLIKINNEFAKKFINISKVVQPSTPRIITNEADVKDISEGSREFVDDNISVSNSNRNSNKLQNAISKAVQMKNKQEMSMQTNSSESSSNNVTTVKKQQKEPGRNEKVSVEYVDGKIVKDVKYKKVAADIKAGIAKLI